MKSLSVALLLGSIVASPVVMASPWLDTSDVFLRDDIQLLADAGVVTVPVTTYPLMWSGIGRNLQEVEVSRLDSKLQTAFLRVRHYYMKATRNEGSRQTKLSLANKTRRFPGFGHQAAETAELSSGVEWLGKRVAVKLNTQLSADDDDNPYSKQRSLTADGSYAAIALGNWSLRAGAVSQWWGPGWDNSLILSDNARPLPALSLTRNDSKAFESPWLSWIGPWTFTAQMAQLESTRAVSRTKLWSTRGTFKPLPSLEIGGSWSIMWGGEGQPGSVSDFFKAVTNQSRCAGGRNTCPVDDETKYGNHLAGVDVRWSSELLGQPFALYGQTIGEDAGGSLLPADKAYIGGIESTIYWSDERYRVFAEYAKTEVDCRVDQPGRFDCYYEHDETYFSGYRYKGRALGASIDNDAVGWTLGVMNQRANHHSWQAKVRYLKLNTNDRDLFPDNPMQGNTASKVAENVIQLDMSYRIPLGRGMLTFGGDLSRSKIVKTQKTDTDANVFASWEYRY